MRESRRYLMLPSSRTETAVIPPRRLNHALGDDAPAHELHRTLLGRDGLHGVDTPATAAVETGEPDREPRRLGNVDAILELPATRSRTDRPPAESEDGLPHHANIGLPPTSIAEKAVQGGGDSAATSTEESN